MLGRQSRVEHLVSERTATLEFIHAITVAANDANDVDDVIETCTAKVCKHTGWPLGYAYLLDPDDHDNLIPTDQWHLLDTQAFGSFVTETMQTQFRRGVGLPGRVLEQAQPVWIADISADANFPRKAVADQAGIVSAIATPVLVGSEVSAVLEFFSTDRLDPDPSFLQALAQVGLQVGRVIERKKIDTLKSEFISTVSHELRTPLTSIKGSLGLIKGGIVGELPAKLQSMIEIAHRNSNRLVHLVNDILDIERIEAGKLDFHMVPQSIMDLVEQAVDANRFYAEEHSTTLVIVESLEDAMIYGDGNRIEQVLANLLSNAAKFSSEGDDIEIRVSRQGPSIRVSVTDHGSGIPQDFRKLIFGKFAQADASDTRQKGGTGLGLSITKALVESHGGRIDFVTEEGSGTTFFIDLPEWAQPQGDLLVDAKGRVLICEDDPDIQQVLVSLLGDDGFDTDVAATATQAKAKLAGNTYVAMTLDIGLPDQDGIALIRELRKEEPTLVLPIVVVSATSSESHGVATGDAINIVDWIEKPIDNERLLRSVRHSQELSRTRFPWTQNWLNRSVQGGPEHDR